MSKYSLVAIGCSAGGVEALKKMLPLLPLDFSIPVVVIQHRGSNSPQVLTAYFSEICALRVTEPDDKEPLVPGTIYIAPANYHIMVDENRCVNFSVDEAVQYSRPSIDVFFETAASVYKEELVGIILSGANTDGAVGLLEIKRQGGLTLVQEPATADFATMPEAAIKNKSAERVLVIQQILNLLREIGGMDGKNQNTSC